MSATLAADRGESIELDGISWDAAKNPTWLASARLGRLRVVSPARSAWVQMRGCSRVDSAEGEFLLRRGDWIVFAHDSQPAVQSGDGALTLGLAFPSDEENLKPEFREHLPLVGRGTMSSGRLSMTMRLWRNAALRAPSQFATQSFLLNLRYSQQALMRQLNRCPGKSVSKKWKRFELLQRTRLYLEGNSNRVVLLSELAQMMGCTTFHMSKTFTGVYESTPRSLAAQYRMTRACYLLTNTAMAISEISSACGFDSQAAFARAFRAANGMTASMYRVGVGQASLATLSASPETEIAPLV